MLSFTSARTLSPIDYPKLEIDQKTYLLKVDMWTLFQYEKISGANTPALTGLMLGSSVTICTLLAAALGTVEASLWRPAPFAPEQLAEMIPIGNLKDIAELLTAAVKKVQPVSTPPDQEIPAAMALQQQ